MNEAALPTSTPHAIRAGSHAHGARRRGDRRKRAFDILATSGGLAFALPLMALVCLAMIPQGWPLVYRHRRVGRGGREFGCLKFRTMVRDADAVLERHLASDREAAAEWAATRKLRRDPRVTLVGRLLRKTSLDELPQLFNVMAGDMSLVGPRPIVRAEMVHYGEHLPRYLSLRPGLTGPWQVGGRSDASYETRVALDAAYAERRSLRRDVAIVAMTIPAVLFARGSR